MPMTMTAGEGFAGIAPDHLATVLAPLIVPILIWGSLQVAGSAAAAGWPLTRRFLRGYRRAAGAVGLVAIVLLLAGIIHLLLIPAHLTEAPTTALLFTLNGRAFTALSAGVFLWASWRPAAGLLLAVVLGLLAARRLGLAVAAPAVEGALAKLVDGHVGVAAWRHEDWRVRPSRHHLVTGMAVVERRDGAIAGQ